MHKLYSLLILLMVTASVLPVFSGYVLCLFSMIFGFYLLKFEPLEVGADSLHQRHYRIWWYTIPAFLFSLLVSETIRTLFEKQSNAAAVYEFAHLIVKYGLLWFFPLVFLFRAMKHAGSRRTLAISLLVIAVVHFVYCLVQRYTGLNIREGLDAVLPPNRFAYGVYRVSGFSNHPLTIGYQLCVLVVMSLGLSFVPHFSKIERWALRIASLTFFFTILISGSRGPQLVVVLSCIPFLLLFSLAKRLMIFGLLIPFVGLIGWKLGLLDRFKEVSSLLASGDSRLMDLQVYWLAFSENPLIGLGIGGFKQEILTYYQRLGGDGSIGLAHNMFLQIVAESGLIGLFGFLIWLFGWAFAAFSVNQQSVRISLLSLLLMMGLSCLTQNSMRDSEVLYTLVFSTQALLGVYSVNGFGSVVQMGKIKEGLK